MTGSGRGTILCQPGLARARLPERTRPVHRYGHTHHYEIVPLDEDLKLHSDSQVYFNSGTWHSYYALAIKIPWNKNSSLTGVDLPHVLHRRRTRRPPLRDLVGGVRIKVTVTSA